MRDGRFRQNAVAQIEDQPARAEVRQHILDGAVERRAACLQRQRIEIALHCDAALNALADECRFRRPVDAHAVDRNAIDIARERTAGAPWEADDLRIRHLLPDLRDDLPGGFETPAIEFGW